MKLLCAIIFLLSVWGIAAGEVPKVIARLDGKPIGEKEIAPFLKRDLLAENIKDPVLRRQILRDAAEKAACMTIVNELLAAASVTPSRERAQQELDNLNSLLPFGLPGLNINKTAEDPDYQLSVAIKQLFCSTLPDKMTVSQAEVEQFYRYHQAKFTIPGKCEYGILQVTKDRPNAADLCDTARLRILQGESFDRVAGEVDPNGINRQYPQLTALIKSEGEKLAVGEISPIIERTDCYLLIQLKSKTPPRYLPLEDADPYIREIILSEKSAKLLEIIVRTRMNKSFEFEKGQ